MHCPRFSGITVGLEQSELSYRQINVARSNPAPVLSPLHLPLDTITVPAQVYPWTMSLSFPPPLPPPSLPSGLYPTALSVIPTDQVSPYLSLLPVSAQRSVVALADLAAALKLIQPLE